MLAAPVDDKAKDWGENIEIYDEIVNEAKNKKNLFSASEAETRFHIVDRIIRELLNWKYNQITVEERTKEGYVDYILRSGNDLIIIEAKKIGSSFPNFTKNKLIKLSSSLLNKGPINEAIKQVTKYGKHKGASLYVVTNGSCWVCFSKDSLNSEDNNYAHLFFPLENIGDAENLFLSLNSNNIAEFGISKFTRQTHVAPENKIINIVDQSDTRIDRNNIAEHIADALNIGLYSEAILSNPEVLKKCFVHTQSRIKYDSILKMHLVDPKPIGIESKSRIKTNKQNGPLEEIIKKQIIKDFPPPVTLIIGEVGTGKSTYLKHFEIVSGKELITQKNVHWIYIDLEKIGSGDPRKFIYEELKRYLLDKTDYSTVIEPAYRNEIQSLRKGPYAPIAKSDPKKFNEIITQHIENDLKNTEPYVDKILLFLSKITLCVIVLDNIDLYQNDELETKVFSEGLSLSKRLLSNVIVSIRDTTYIKHKNDPSFDAFELRKLWLTPPPYKAVLSKRLSLSRVLLKNKHVKISLNKGLILDVPDLSVFFDIVQRSVLTDASGDFFEYMSGDNIRRGIGLIKNFLTSGHIQADRAIKNYLTDSSFSFPFHEIFKGSILSFWKYYKETRCDYCINIFDSSLPFENALLLRLFLITFLYNNSLNESSAKVEVRKCLEIFTKLGITDNQLIEVINLLKKALILKTTDNDEVSINSIIYLTKTGGYYRKILSCRFVYFESSMYDTQIFSNKKFESLSDYTIKIEHEFDLVKKMDLRIARAKEFILYLKDLEKKTLKLVNKDLKLDSMAEIEKSINLEMDKAYKSVRKNYKSK